MHSLREIKSKHYMPSSLQLQLMMVGVAKMITLIARHPGAIKKLQEREPLHTEIELPKREYDLPDYKEGMNCSSSTEKYLRPTLYCDHTKPEIIALAHQLGAHKVSDLEFATHAFEFVKNNLHIQMPLFNDVDVTLERGTGNCYHLNSLFIALCRCAGIKARYKLFAMNVMGAMNDAIVGFDPVVKQWNDNIGYFMLEAEAEAFVDGLWRPAHCGPTPERQAAAGIPITRFGEDSIGNWFYAKEGTIMHVESIPYGLATMIFCAHKLAPGSMERFNISVEAQHLAGKNILKNYKSVKAYDEEIRRKIGPKAPEVKIKERSELIFK